MIICRNVFNVWPKTTLLPLWPRDATRLDAPGKQPVSQPESGLGTQGQTLRVTHKASRLGKE